MFHADFTLMYIVDLAGVAVFAISGALAAGRKGMDILGVFVISVVTSVGGGTLRDLLLDRFPLFWIADPTYLTVIAVASLGTLIWVRRRRPPGKALLVADALGLAFFTVAGCRISEASALSPVIVVVMGTMTGVAGGVLRDILSAEVPLILRRDIYATAAIAGAATYLVTEHWIVSGAAAFWSGFAVVLILRALAIVWGLRLPVFRLPAETA